MTAICHKNHTARKIRVIAPARKYMVNYAKNEITIVKTAANGIVYRDILSVRCQVNDVDIQTAANPNDMSADLYCIYLGGRPVGTMRVTRASNGKLDCEEYYPAELVERYRDRIGSAHRPVSRAGLSGQQAANEVSGSQAR